MTRVNRTYIILIVLFLVFGMYFTAFFKIAIENKSGKTIPVLEIENTFKHQTYYHIPNDSVIVVRAFIPYSRKIKIRTQSDASIQSFLFTASNAYAGTKYNTVIIKEDISLAKP